MHIQETLDTQNLLDQFWVDCYSCPKKTPTHQAVVNLLRGFRKTLQSSSKTAMAIDMDDPLDEIIRCSEEEGFMEVAQLLTI